MCGLCGTGALLCTIFSIVMLVLVTVFLLYGISFFKEASEFYRGKKKDHAKKHEHMSEMLAKMDQLVDVLKVK